ncbi:hypothetical protein RDV64_17030 [Acuticoccus sp. MNP-M23]|uniref:hypothetical protein n=1 Tax=Acuticoccus sp. MNP-M23 TaxID=3072793 RepID=UPI002815636D|nr:hypothetical protein [Acuticoccus sp. MNP-M23]WMS41758.1 hypothetical protein RDV64_17030 [Acuticoccus sp. MNP-M23]
MTKRGFGARGIGVRGLVASAAAILVAVSLLVPVGPAVATEADRPVQLAFLGKLFGGGRGGCSPAGAVTDPDVSRNAAAIRAGGLCVSTETVSENGITWTFIAIENPRSQNGPVWYLPHDNESAAFDAAVYAVARYGGAMIALETGERREYRSIDPNRHFARDRGDAGPCRMRAATPRYTKTVMGFFDGKRHILAMHNNTRGGAVSASMRTAKSTGFRAKGPLADADNMVFIAGTRPIQSDRRGQNLRDMLLRAGLNVVYEHVTPQNSDCSFSNYVALNDRRDYFNIEAVHGSREQTAMVDRLMQVLGYRPVR